MNSFNKKLLLIICAFVLIITIAVLVFLNLTTQNEPQNPNNPSPRVTNLPTSQKLTPLQKTEIGKTTDAEVRQGNYILSVKQEGSKTIYEVTSNTFGATDEIITQDGNVISERVDTFNRKVGQPPKVNAYIRLYGEPEEKIRSVSPLGKHITAYLYPTQGFTLFVNENTGTVYQVQRFEPLSLTSYKTNYASYIQEAPEYPKEGQ